MEIRSSMRKYEAFTVREAKEDDLDGLLALYSQLNSSPRPEITSALISHWQKILSTDMIHVIVAEETATPHHLISTCCCTVIPTVNHGCHPFALIEYVVTDENHRRTGAGKACLDYAVCIAEEENCYKAMLVTGRRESHVFYKNCGFSAEGKTAFVRMLR